MSVQNEVQDLSNWIKYSTGMVSLLENLDKINQSGARDVASIVMEMFGETINNWMNSDDASVKTMHRGVGTIMYHARNVIVDLESKKARISSDLLPNDHEVSLFELTLNDNGTLQIFWSGEDHLYHLTAESLIQAQTNLFLSSQIGRLSSSHVNSLCELVFDGLIPATALNGAPWLEELKDPLKNSVEQYGVYCMLGSRVGVTIRDKFMDHTPPMNNHIGELVSMVVDNYMAGRLSIAERIVCIKAITEISVILELLVDSNP